MKALTIGACVLLGAFVAARAVLVPLTYDEAAGYLRYTSQGILAAFNFEVATNHFLNTLLTKLVAIVAGDSEVAQRAAGLIGYGLYLLFSVLILRDLRHRLVAAAGFVLLNLNPYLLDYFALSRGYSLSLGLLLGAVYFLLRFVRRRLEGATGAGELSRGLMFACGSVLASFSSLDAYLGVAVVAFAVMWITRPKGSVLDGSRFPGFSIWLPIVAASFTFLVLLQDYRLTSRLYEPISISIAGLDDGELQAIKIWRVDLRRRPVEVPRAQGGSVWRVDPPTAVRGLRLEFPASAAERLQDSRALVETVIGTRPFVQRRSADGTWTMRDSGGTNVFESGPLLSLPKSRMDQYDLVINWGGDGRHLGWVAAYTALVMGILAGFGVLLGLTGALLRRLRIGPEEWRALAAGLLWVAALAGTPLYLLRRSEELYYGGTRGFVEDTFHSLIENSFYGKTYVASQTDIVFGVIVATLVLFVMVAVASYRLGILREVAPSACILGILVVASAAVLAQNRLFGTPFLLSRTALFYIPLFVLFSTFVLDVLAQLGAPGKVLATSLAAASAVLAVAHLAGTANVSYTWDWKKDAGTRAMIDDLAGIINAERPAGSRVVLGVEPGYSAPAAFYSEKCRTATIEMDTIPSPRAVDYLYVDERNAGSLSVIKKYPVAHSVLARPERPR